MSDNQREAKIYGAVNTDSYITFNGFCKKIYSSEQQKIQVFIDGNLIDTIEANKSINEIEEKYDIYDTNGFCFEYSVPKEYIGEKHVLEFKTEDDHQLLHSPSFTANESSPKYNEYMFSESILENIDYEESKNIFKKNIFAFFASTENLKSKEFINYIAELHKIYSNCKFKVFYFEKKDKFLAEKIFLFLKDDVEFLIPKNINSLASEIEIFLLSKKDKYLAKVFEILIYKYENIYAHRFYENNKSDTLEDEENNNKVNPIFLNHTKHFGIENIENSPFKSLFNGIFKEINEKELSDLNISSHDFHNYTLISYALKHQKYKTYYTNKNNKYLELIK